jgi:hypothetical protein
LFGVEVLELSFSLLLPLFEWGKSEFVVEFGIGVEEPDFVAPFVVAEVMPIITEACCCSEDVEESAD